MPGMIIIPAGRRDKAKLEQAQTLSHRLRAKRPLWLKPRPQRFVLTRVSLYSPLAAAAAGRP